jgi:hypothetical protein
MADSFTLKAIISAVDKLTPTLKVIQTQAKVSRKYLGDLGSSVNNLASKFGIGAGLFAGIAAGFGIGAIRKAVVAYADLGEEVIKGAYKAGMSTDEYQRMKYVAEQAGVPIDMLGLSMGKLNKNLGTAAMGKNEALADLMRQLKIPMRDANGEMRSAADLLPQLSQAFVRNQDPIKQAAIGTAMFGKAYQEMLPFLNEGPEGIAKSLARFNELKGVIPREDLEGAKEFGDKLQDLQAVTKGFQMTIAKQLVPVLSPLVEQFVQWAAANKKLIGSEVKKIVQGLVEAAKSMDWVAFVASVRSTFEAVGAGIEKVGGLRNALIALAVVMNASTIGSLFGVVGAIGRAGLAFGALIPQAYAAATATGVFAAAQDGAAASAAASGAAIGGGLLKSLIALASSATLLAAAAAVGYAIGSVIYKAIAETDFADFLGRSVAKVLAFFGNQTAKDALAAQQAFDRVQLGYSASAPRATTAPVPENAGAGGSLVRVAPKVTDAIGTGTWRLGAPEQAMLRQAARPAAMSPQLQAIAVPATRAVTPFVATLPKPPEGAGAESRSAGGPARQSGTPPVLNQPQTVSLAGKLDVRFMDAPPGLRVEQAKTDGARVALNTSVGYRYTAAMGY